MAILHTIPTFRGSRTGSTGFRGHFFMTIAMINASEAAAERLVEGVNRAATIANRTPIPIPKSSVSAASSFGAIRGSVPVKSLTNKGAAFTLIAETKPAQKVLKDTAQNMLNVLQASIYNAVTYDAYSMALASAQRIEREYGDRYPGGYRTVKTVDDKGKAHFIKVPSQFSPRFTGHAPKLRDTFKSKVSVSGARIVGYLVATHPKAMAIEYGLVGRTVKRATIPTRAQSAFPSTSKGKPQKFIR